MNLMFKRHQLAVLFFIMPKLQDKISQILRSESASIWLLPLSLISFLYRGIVGVRNSLYDTGILKIRKLACKVISVGNITVGGTGKTPMVIMLANLFKENGYTPVVLSRGYKGRKKDPVNIVSNGEYILMSSEEAGDEPALIAKEVINVPVLSGKRRQITGKYAIDHFGADILILDDAFQHRALSRDIDIVLMDRQRPFGNGFTIPRGSLREPTTALRRADIIVLTGTEENDDIARRSDFISLHHAINQSLSDKKIFSAYRKPRDLIKGRVRTVFPIEYLQDKKIVAFAGIAEPEYFRKTILSVGGDVVRFIAFPDHYLYESQDILEIRDALRESAADIILTTEKDGTKLIGFPEFLDNIFILRIDMEIVSLQEEFKSLVMEMVQK